SRQTASGWRLVQSDRIGCGGFGFAPFDSLSAELLPGTEAAEAFFWSPDSRYLAFFTGSKLKRIDFSGGVPEILCNVPAGSHATWNQAGVVLVGYAEPGKPVERVDLNDCRITPATRLDTSQREIRQS